MFDILVFGLLFQKCKLRQCFVMFQASLICDFIVLYVLKARTLYREKKYLQVVGDDAYKVSLI